MKKILILSAIFILVFSLSSCNLPFGVTSNTQSDIKTAVAMQVALTQVAGTMTSIAVANPPTETLAPVPPTSTNTPQPTLTPTLQGVWLTVRENTNCRSGPGTYYDFVTLLTAGTKVEALARNPNNDYYYIRNPNSGSSFCWLWDEWSDVAGNITILPVFTPQATPTPAFTNTPTAGFSLSYVGLVSCGLQFAIKVKIVNTGSVTWESIKMMVKDKTNSTDHLHTSNTFKEWSGCVSGLVQQDLTPGESSFVLNVNPGQLNYDPTGHELKVTVTLYSKDDYTGTSASQSFTKTP